MKIQYVEKLGMNKANQQKLVVVNKIIAEYRKQGYKLTLRQLYYQLVSRGIIPNKLSEYAKLSTLLTKGRMAGVVDWDAIEDRLRIPDKPSAWESPQEIIEAVAKQYRRDRMWGQDVHIEVWVEKDALSGVLKRITHKYGVYLMVNRGYSSTTAMHDSYQRFLDAWQDKKRVIILYFGDHDPSGIDMVRDIRDRVEKFVKGHDDTRYSDYYYDEMFEMKRVALTQAQIKEFNPPPNPTKMTDTRADWYIKKYGHTCWEVDALPPQKLNELVEDTIYENIDIDIYQDQLDQEEEEKEKLKKVAEKMRDGE